MDPEEEKVWYLSRVGREKIFKYGTYTLTHDRAITQEHPFYAERDDMAMTGPVSYIPPGQDAMSANLMTDASAGSAGTQEAAPDSAPPPPPSASVRSPRCNDSRGGSARSCIPLR